MTNATETRNQPDTLGLAVAEVAQRAAAPDTVILFGSRARGDHRDNSDVDLFIVRSEEIGARKGNPWQAVQEYFDANPPELHVDIITMGRERFAYCSRAQNHVAGQALRDGVIMSGENLDCSSDYDDGYPVGWPATSCAGFWITLPIPTRNRTTRRAYSTGSPTTRWITATAGRATAGTAWIRAASDRKSTWPFTASLITCTILPEPARPTWDDPQV